MKKLVLAILFTASIPYAVFAQCDPGFGPTPTFVGTSTVAGVPTLLVGESGTLNFTFGVGTDPTCNAGAGNIPGNIVITISFTNNYGPASAADISGPQASLYDWVWDAPGRTMIGINNAPIPVGPAAAFTVNVKGLVITPGNIGPPSTLNWFSESNPPITNDLTGDDSRSLGLNVDAALPVTLTSFMAAREGKQANLNWATTMETNSDRFEVERSLNGKNWDKIGIVASHGESSSLKNYTFTDRTPSEGENLYRLRMIDKDGTFEYSRIRAVSFEGLNKDLSVYPNPAVEKITIRDFEKVSLVEITDMNGRVVMRSAKMTTGEIQVKSLSTGSYLVKITHADGGVSTQKILIGK